MLRTIDGGIPKWLRIGFEFFAEKKTSLAKYTLASLSMLRRSTGNKTVCPGVKEGCPESTGGHPARTDVNIESTEGCPSLADVNPAVNIGQTGAKTACLG